MLKFKTLIPGISAASLIIIVLGTALLALWEFAIRSDNLTIYFDYYLLHVIWITFFQASLSTLLSIICAVFMAKALSMVDFFGKSLLLRIMPVTFILPTLVVVTGLLAVYGQQGFLVMICRYFGLSFSMSIYGLQGILLAHLFLNFPYACRLFYQTLNSVPVEQTQLAAQLNFSNFTFFKIVEWPLLRRQILPMSALIFMLCFSSFAIVLALGGGPKYTTIEVAIYQSIRDFELMQSVVLSCLQLFCCISFMWLLGRINRVNKLTVKFTNQHYRLPISLGLSMVSVVIILLGALFIFTPIVSILFEGLYYFKFSLLNITFIQAISYSFIIAISSAIMSMLLGCLLLWTNSRLLINHSIKWSNRLMLVGSLTLAIPSMVLASGFFLLLYDYANSSLFICILMIVCNSLMALPFVLKNLETAMYDISLRYWQLSESLNITGFKHFYLIECKALKRLMLMSFAFSTIFSLGDFSIIALFGGQSVITLPYYLYEQISHYHFQDGAVTAALLLVLSLSLLVVIDYDRI